MSNAPPVRGATVFLREITADSLAEILKLRVRDDQARFVAPNVVSIARAHFHPEAWFRAVYAGDTPVGFLMLDDRAQLEGPKRREEYFLWRFMVDHRYQGLCFGRQALDLLVQHVRTRPGARELGTSCVPGEGSPKGFYLKYGFVETGVVDEGEEVLRLIL